MSCRHPRVDRIYKDGGYTCVSCGRFVSAEAIKRGLNARRRGNRLSARAAKDGGLENVERLQLPEDHRASHLKTQHKSGKGYPKRLDAWLRAMSAEPGQLRAVVYTETPGPGKKARRLIVMDYSEYLDWHGPVGS